MAPPPSKAADPERQLMIKTKACQRLSKEALYYQQEVKDNEVKLQLMKDENKDPYDIKRFQQVLDESYMMIPDSQARFEKSLEDLKECVEMNFSSEGGEWSIKAREFLKEHDVQVAGDKHENGETEETTTTSVEELKDGEAF